MIDPRHELAQRLKTPFDIARTGFTEGTMTSSGVKFDGVSGAALSLPYVGEKPPVGSRVLVGEAGAGRRYILGVITNG